ncbi:MAG: hypothetical protein ACFE9Z_17185, partial [Promethearchaeota archaeon]
MRIFLKEIKNFKNQYKLTIQFQDGKISILYSDLLPGPNNYENQWVEALIGSSFSFKKVSLYSFSVLLSHPFVFYGRYRKDYTIPLIWKTKGNWYMHNGYEIYKNCNHIFETNYGVIILDDYWFEENPIKDTDDIYLRFESLELIAWYPL